MKVFLGGTVNGSKWRDIVKEKLAIDYFDPVVDDWTDAAHERELSERHYSDYVLYVLTPKMTGFYAVAEVTDDSYQRPDRTIFCYLPEDDGEKFSEEQIEELNVLGKVVSDNGAVWLKNLDEVTSFLNSAKLSDTSLKSPHFDAFISYGRRESQHFADSISNRLREKGFTVYKDLGEIPLILESEEYILNNIRHSDNFIYVVSPNTVRSAYCKKELDFAIKNNKRIIPVIHNELGVTSKELDSILANNPKIEVKEPQLNIDEVVEEVEKIIRTDQD